MTPEELDKLTPEQQWNVFGCGSRCMRRLYQLHGKDISKEDFLAKFAGLYPPKRIGLTNTAEQIQMGKELGICRSANAFRDWRKVKWTIEQKIARGVIVNTDRTEDGEGENFHSRLLLKYNDTEATLFSPDQSGDDFEIPVTWESLEKQRVHFLVFV